MRAGELVGAIGGLGLLVAGFLPWYSAGGVDATGWQAFSVTDILLAAAAAVALSVAICVLFRISVSYPVAGSSVATGFGFVAVVLIVIRMINPPGPGDPSVEYRGLARPRLGGRDHGGRLSRDAAAEGPEGRLSRLEPPRRRPPRGWRRR